MICMHWYGANIYQLEILSENDEVTSFCLLLLRNVLCGRGESHQAYKQLNMVFMMKHWLTFPYQNVKKLKGKKFRVLWSHITEFLNKKSTYKDCDAFFSDDPTSGLGYSRMSYQNICVHLIWCYSRFLSGLP